MTPQDYWNGDPRWVQAYFDNFEEDQRNEWKMKDALNWQLGQYVMAAIGATFGEGKYPDDLLFYQPTREELIEKSKKELAQLFGV